MDRPLEVKDGYLINVLATDLLNTSTINSEESTSVISDSSWGKQAFNTAGGAWIGTSFITSANLDPIDLKNRSFSSAYFKYTDSSLGGNFCINPPAQFTRYADIRDKGIRKDAVDTILNHQIGALGMGRYYSEAIDDNSQVIHLRFGVPQYNSLTQFFTGFYNSSASSMARTGRMDDTFVQKFLSFGGTVIAIAILPLAIIPMAISLTGSALRYFMKWPSSKFYTLKPTMPMYWNSASSMLNQIGMNKGVIHYNKSATEKDGYVGMQHKFDQNEFNLFNTLFPEFNKSGLIDLYAISNKSKRLEIRHRTAMQNAQNSFEKGGNVADRAEEWKGRVNKFMTEEGGGLDTPTVHERASFTIESYISSWYNQIFGRVNKEDIDIEKDPREKGDPSLADRVLSFIDFTSAEAAEGGEWVSFRVDHTGPASESFTNNTAESTLAQKINSQSSSSRNLRINFANGNVGDIPGLSTIVEGVSAVVRTVADTLHLSGLAALAGNAFIDIPKHWEGSTTNLNKSTYTLTLTSPYGNEISQMLHIYTPLCLLLAGCLPLSTGKQSYTAPFLCELYDRGRSITRLGMIDSLSIQRGTSNLGFNNNGAAMAIDVTFTVLDLSTIVAMPISQGFSYASIEGLFDDENSFSDYLMTLSGLSLRDTEQRWPKLLNQVGKVRADLEQFFSASHWGSVAGNYLNGGLLGALMRGAGTRSATGS